MISAIFGNAGSTLLYGVPFVIFLLFRWRNTENNSRRVAVLVLGDIGRSPRMQNHAVSLAKAEWNVDLIGFKGNIEEILLT
jgi:hypothetical protein